MRKKCCSCLLFSLVLSVLSANAFGQGIHFLNDEPFEKILALAKEQNKTIFVDGYTKTCKPCKELDLKVFPLVQVGEYFNSNFINVKYDLEEPEGKKFRQKYKDVITCYPSLILIDPSGKMIHKIGGFQEADTLIGKMKSALKGRSLSVMRERLQAGEKSAELAQTYKEILEDGWMPDELEAMSRVILDRVSDQEMLYPKLWAPVGRWVTDPYSPIFARVVKNYWLFVQKRTTDVGFLEFQLRTGINNAAQEILKPEEKDGKLILKSEPEKQALLLGFVSDSEKFKYSESIKAMFDVHDLALAGHWANMVTAMQFYNRIGALGRSATFTQQYTRYMMQFCKDKKVLTEAAALLASLPKETQNVPSHGTARR